MTTETTQEAAPLVAIRQDDAEMLLTLADLYAPHEHGTGKFTPDVAPVIERVREAVKGGEGDEITDLRAERDEAQSEAAMIRDHAHRYFRARYGPDYIYRAPETFENALEQWIWAVGAGVPELAHSSIEAIERFFAGRNEAGASPEDAGAGSAG